MKGASKQRSIPMGRFYSKGETFLKVLEERLIRKGKKGRTEVL